MQAQSGFSLLFAGVLGWFAHAFACAYARQIARGAQVDDRAFRVALRDALGMPRRADQSPRNAWLTVLCVLAMVAVSAWPNSSLLPLALHLPVCAILLALALIDIRCGLLPDALTLPLLWAGLLVAWAGVNSGVSLEDAVAGAAGGYAFLWLVDLLYRLWRGHRGLGGGDMKLVGALGAWLGWQPLVGLLFIACVGGLLHVAVRSRLRLTNHALAFGPFLAFAGVVGLHGVPVVQLVFCLGNTACSRWG